MTTMTYEQIDKQLTGRCKNGRKLENNTYANRDGNAINVCLHATDIVRLFPDGRTILASGGWRTATTKDRMNKYSPYRVSQSKGIWYVSDGERETVYFDGITLPDDLCIDGSEAEKELLALKKKINKFVAILDRVEEIPLPNRGDCWLCSMFERGKMESNDHLLQHIEEGYMHGSLLVNAMRFVGYSDAQIGLHYSMKLKDTFKRALRRFLKARLLK